MYMALWQTKRQKLITSTVVGFAVTLVAAASVYAYNAYSDRVGTASPHQKNTSSETQPTDKAAKNSEDAPAATAKKETQAKPSSPKPVTTPPPPSTSAAPSPSSPAPASSESGCTQAGTGQGGYPLPNLVGRANECNTGPRYACTTTQGTLVTSYHGQVIDRVCINGTLEIRHNNVTVRDVLVMGTGSYSLDIGQNTAICPSNLRVEYTEINMTNAGNMDWGIYQRCAGGHVFDHITVLYAGRGMMTYGNLTLNQSYIYSNRTETGAHRTAFSTHGGTNFTITGNTLICVNTGCSSSLNIYSDYAPATNVLIQGNLVAGGSICMRGGETHAYATQTRDIRVLNNRFSTVYAPECGTLQAFAQFDESAPGNVRSGNVYYESGLPIPGE